MTTQSFLFNLEVEIMSLITEKEKVDEEGKQDK